VKLYYSEWHKGAFFWWIGYSRFANILCPCRAWLWATVVSAVIAAVASVLDPNKQYQEHPGAAKAFIVLKHDARFLQEAKSHKLSDEAFYLPVENLHAKRNEIVRV